MARHDDDDLEVQRDENNIGDTEDAPLLGANAAIPVSYGADKNAINNADDEQPPAVAVVAPSESSVTAIFRSLSWRKRLTFITAAVVNFSSMCCFSMMAPFLPLEADAKGIDSTTVGIIFASFQLVNLIGSLVFGRFLTTIGARFLYIAGILMAAICSVLFGVLQWCPPGYIFAIMAISCRVVEAIGCSMCQTAATAIVANEFPDRVATVFGLLESIAGIGLMVGPAIGGALYDLGGFYLPFVCMGFVFFITGVFAACILPTTAITVPKDKNKLLKSFIKLPAVLVCGVCIIMCATFMSFLDPILSKQLAAIDPTLAKSETLIGLVFLVAPGLYAIMSPIVGYLADTFKHQLPLLALGNAGFIISYALIGPCPLLPIPSGLLWLTIISLVLQGLFISFCFMPAFAVISKGCSQSSLPNDLDLYGLIAGFFGFAFNLGAFVGPVLGGFLEQQFGFAWATSIISLGPFINIFALIIFAITSRNNNNNNP